MDIDGQETERFDIRLAPNPAATIEQEALDVAGVTLEQVQSYQPMEEGYRQLVGILSKYVNKFDKRDKMYLVGYNNAGFDNNFLRALFTQCGDKYFGSKCWNCNKEYIFTVIRENDTTELDKMIKRHKEAYEKMLNITKRIERECQKYVIWDTVHVMLKDDGEFIIKALSKDKTVLLNDFIIYVNNNGSIDEEDYDLLLTK